MGGASAATLIVALLSSTVSGTPPQPPADSPLRTIGHVHATTQFCKAALETATSGAGVAIENDDRIGTVIAFLRHTDFDRSEVAKNSGIAALNRQYAELRAEAVRGNGMLASLKEQAAHAPTAQQAHDLLAFADALDGALSRQKRLTEQIARIEVNIDAHAPIDADTRARMDFDQLQQMSLAGPSHDPTTPYYEPPDSLTKRATDGADDLEKRAQPIQMDESRAADLIEPAFAGC